MSDLSVSVTCATHGKSYATFVCQHIATAKGQGFFYGDDDDLRPDALCERCEQFLSAHNDEWTEEVVNLADIKLICAHCYDNARLMNEIPFKRIKPPNRPVIEEDGWELDSAVRQNQLHPATFTIPTKSAIKRLRSGDYVKLIFLFGVENEIGAQEIARERMWVKIQQIAGNNFVGRLDNDPTLSQVLKHQDRIEFRSEHIAAILPQDQLSSPKSQTTSRPKHKRQNRYLH